MFEIRRKEPERKCSFREIKPGALFRLSGRDDLFIRAEKDNISIRLKDGAIISSFDKIMEVICVNGTLIWEDT